MWDMKGKSRMVTKLLNKSITFVTVNTYMWYKIQKIKKYITTHLFSPLATNLLCRNKQIFFYRDTYTNEYMFKWHLYSV